MTNFSKYGVKKKDSMWDKCSLFPWTKCKSRKIVLYNDIVSKYYFFKHENSKLPWLDIFKIVTYFINFSPDIDKITSF